LSQAILLANQRKPYTKKSFSWKVNFVVTARSHLHLKWLEEKQMTPAVAIELLKEYRPSEWPEPWLHKVEAVIDAFLVDLSAKKIGPEYIGKHRVPGFAWPDVAVHDPNHDALLGTSLRHTAHA
jgi:hypothetical protein